MQGLDALDPVEMFVRLVDFAPSKFEGTETTDLYVALLTALMPKLSAKEHSASQSIAKLFSGDTESGSWFPRKLREIVSQKAHPSGIMGFIDAFVGVLTDFAGPGFRQAFRPIPLDLITQQLASKKDLMELFYGYYALAWNHRHSSAAGLFKDEYGFKLLHLFAWPKLLGQLVEIASCHASDPSSLLMLPRFLSLLYAVNSPFMSISHVMHSSL